MCAGGQARFWKGFLNLPSSVPGVKMSFPDPGLAGSVLAAGHGCPSGGWSRQRWPGFPGGTCKQTQCRGQAAASALPAWPLFQFVFVLILTIQIYFNWQPAKVSPPQPAPSESCHALGGVWSSRAARGCGCAAGQGTGPHGARGKGWLLAEPGVVRANDAALPSHCWKFKYFIMHLL